jgi:hypothetical protein
MQTGIQRLRAKKGSGNEGTVLLPLKTFKRLVILRSCFSAYMMSSEFKMNEDADMVVNPSESTVTEYATYEDYLDSQITDTDLYYLEDKELARQLVELGYRGSGETLKREEFITRKKVAENFRLSKRLATKVLSSQGKNLTSYPFLSALAEREEANRNGKLTVIFNH